MKKSWEKYSKEFDNLFNQLTDGEWNKWVTNKNNIRPKKEKIKKVKNKV